MAIIIGGHEAGLLDSSFTLLNRNDRSRLGPLGHGEEAFVNVSNGNLVIQQRDAYLPSQGEDYALVRTYNSRGAHDDAHEHDASGWTLSTTIRLSSLPDPDGPRNRKLFEVMYGDGSVFVYRYDAASGLYVSTDGAGAFETLAVLDARRSSDPAYIVTRANQTRLTFDKQGRLLSSVDTNGVRIDYEYESDRLVRVRDDQGHVIKYVYDKGNLVRIEDETARVLVQYRYEQGRLTEVIDREGHSTVYHYNSQGLIDRIELPYGDHDNDQGDGHEVRTERREIRFEYESVQWRGSSHHDDHGRAHVLTRIVDAEGGVTTFEYDFDFDDESPAGSSHPLHQYSAHDNDNDRHFFVGGTTRVVDALGNNRAYSNDSEYRAWRVTNGYYEYYKSDFEKGNSSFRAQVDAIRNAHGLTYRYNADGYLTKVIDQQGYRTDYVYDPKGNLTSIIDRNGYAAVSSDSDYYRALRAELGYTDAAGLGRRVADLSVADKSAILARFTSTFAYDSRGNLLSHTDNEGHITRYTYTGFNKLASMTSAMGNALVTSDDDLYQQKRVALGYSARVSDLSSADRQALLELYTTRYSYDSRQNLIEQRDVGGDLTRFEYDVHGNLTRRIVYLDAADLADPAKQQVTRYFYDAYGNNIRTIDGEGNQTQSDYDHFGNLTRFIDGNGGVTTYTYDRDHRLLTVKDPEGHLTVNFYDAVGNRVAVRDAGGHTVTYLYDRNNMLVATLDPSKDNRRQDRVTHYAYDVVGNRTEVEDAEGRKTTYVYDARRQLVEVVSEKVADEFGNLTQYRTTYAYDGEGNRIRTVNNRGFATEVLYTPDGLVRQQTDASGHVTRFVYDANHNQVTIIAGVQLPEARRQVLRFAYDEEDQLIAQTDAEGNTTRFAYDAPGNRVSVVDANGHTTDFQYDRNNRLIRETRPAVIDPRTGLSTRYTVLHQFDANGNEIATTDENGNTTRFSFDRDNRLVLVSDANGIQTVYTYDSRHNRTSVQIGVQASINVAGKVVVGDVTNAQVTSYTYNEFNELVAKTDGVGNALAASDAALYQEMRRELGYAARVSDLTNRQKQALRDLYTERYTYDRVGNRTSMVDSLTRATSYTYDSLNRLVKRKDALNQATTYRYDGNGNLVSQTDALGRATHSSYDAVDRLISTVDPLGVTTSRVYDAFGNLTAETRAAGTIEARTNTYEYDLNNRLVRQTDPEGHAQAYEYDAVGNRLRVIDARGHATRYVYDALNRNIRIIDPLAFETRFEYDGVGNRIALIDARGGVTRFDYDPGNRRIEATDAEGRVTRFQYDVRGNRVVQITAYGTPAAETTVYEYDAENNLRRVIDAEGHETTHDYDRVYNRVSVTDGNGHTTAYAFDAINRQIEMVDAEGGRTTYRYDAVGNRIEQTDALGRVATFFYDANNRQIVQTAADGVQTHYTYDRVGNRVSITRAANTADAATTQFVYDRDDRLIAQTDALGNTTTFEYDATHNRTAVVDPHGHRTEYVYDANNRVTRIVDPLGNTTGYRYDGNGNRVQVIDARGYATTSYFNADNEVVLSVDAEGYATTYQYDANGNIVAQTLHAAALSLPLDPSAPPAPVAGPRDQTTRFEYDRLNRLTARIDAEGFRAEFRYDAVGNRLETRQFLDLSGTRMASTFGYYDKTNRQIASLTAEGYLTTFAYDAAGNRVARTIHEQRVFPTFDGSVPLPTPGDAGRTTTYAYDAVNRLTIEISALGIRTEYEYDARGNRIAQTEAAGTTDSRRTEYRYDAANRLTDAINALGVVTHMDLDAVGSVIARHDAYGTAFERITRFEYDGNHRLIQETSALGVVTRNTYDAAGNRVATTSAAGLPEQRTETFAYDGNNRLIAQTNGEGERTEYAYDAAGNRVRLTQAPGLPEERSNYFEYDRDNRLAAAIDAMGVRTEYRYDGAGNKRETIQAIGIAGQERHSFYQYDLDNRLVAITDPLGGMTRYEYDVLGNQTSIVNANGGVQINTFDAAGRLLSSRSPGGVLTVNTYDVRGNILATTQSLADGTDARTTAYAYDLLDRQVRVTDPEGFSTSIGYDAFGNQVHVAHGQYLVDPLDPAYDPDKAARAFVVTNAFEYDAADRLRRMTDGEGNTTEYAHDAVGNRIAVTEAANSVPRTTRYAYDLANRLVETRTPEGGIARNVYDEVGNKIAERQLQGGDEATGTWIHKTFEYDRNGRLTAEIDPYGVRTEHGYDAMGNMLRHRFAAGTADERFVRMEYDLNNRKTADIDAEGNRTEYAYDAMGNRIRVTDARGHTARFYFDGNSRLISVLDAEGYINAFTYDSAGNRTSVTVYMSRHAGPVSDTLPPVPSASPGDRTTLFAYNGIGREIARTEADGARTEFRYDGAGNLISEIRFANTASPRHVSYRYDLNNRLVRFTDIDGTVTTMAYDGANNKVRESIHHPGDPNATRTTEFAYDLNNRKVREVFDPAGLAIVQTLAYDRLGNAVTKTNGNGVVTAYVFDLNNRLLSETVDPAGLALTTGYAYDAVGNVSALTDARGHVTRFAYDGNNRLTLEIRPEVDVYTIDGNLRRLSPTVQHRYDAAGNEVQVIDPNGAVTTRYFDGNNRLTAELNADNVLRAYGYNATGDQTSETLYMTRLSAASHDPANVPTPPSGEARTIEREYDLRGRLTKVTYPAVELTFLGDTGGNNPTAIRITQQPVERRVYDAFGNVIEAYDRNGNRNVSYYDVKGRQVAVVDALGYLTEWDYDAQDNVLEQRIYTRPLEPATVNASVRPTPPAGEIYGVSRTYDAASRLVEEKSPAIEVFDPVSRQTSVVRPTARYRYDQVGNQISRTLAAGTAQEVTEYQYYDAANRQVAVINAGRVLHRFGYDANGNLTTQVRYINTVSPGIDPALLNGRTDFAALVSPDAGQDQARALVYDALNRLTSESDLMGPGPADDLTKNYQYDATTQRTWARDEDGYIVRTAYDALGQIRRTISPDGSGTFAEYDAAGNQIRVYTGQMDNQALPPSNLAATLGGGLTLSWNAANGQRTWVVFDSVSHASVSDYGYRSPTQTSFGTPLSAALSLPGLGVGGSVYYRVVTQDIAGNTVWTGEQRVILPPRFTELAVASPAADVLEVYARFDAGTQNPVLEFGALGNTASSTAFVLQADGRYKATITGVTDPGALAFRLAWSDATGGIYRSAEQSFAASAAHVGLSTTVTQGTITGTSGTRYTIEINSRVPSALAAGISLLEVGYRPAGSPAGTPYAMLAVAGTDSVGYRSFAVTLGEGEGFAAGSRYEIVLTAVDADGNRIALDTLEYETGTAAVAQTHQTVSWNAPVSGSDQLMIVNGRLIGSQRHEGRVLTDVALSGPATGYNAFYGDRFTASHALTVTSTPVTEMQGNPPVPVLVGYDLGIGSTFEASEIANMNGGLRLAWRPAGSGTAFPNDIAVPANGTTGFSTTLSRLAAGEYDLKLYYLDTAGREVIVDWRRADTAQASVTTTGASLTVLARETGGRLRLDAHGAIVVEPGLYTGALDAAALITALTLGAVETIANPGSASVDARNGYFTEFVYNALNARIASNETDGLWRTFGVDANGNTLETRLYGDKAATGYIATFSQYDARNRVIADWDAAVNDPTTGVLTHPVTRLEYNVLDKITRRVEAQNRVREYGYNALGTRVTDTVYDDINQPLTETTRVDIFGRPVAVTSRRGHTSYNFHDSLGRLVRERDASGREVVYGYDAFDRRTSVTDGRGVATATVGDFTTRYAYDQRDRLTTVHQAQGWHLAHDNAAVYQDERERLGFAREASDLSAADQQALIDTYRLRFEYDGRNNRTGVIDPRGNRTDQVFDGLGRVTDTISYLNGRALASRRAYDAFGNLISETDAVGRQKSYVYGNFSRLLEEIDEDGNRFINEYDRYGRVVRETSPQTGKDIERAYDAAGRLLSVIDRATGTSTVYTYDLLGQRLTEGLTTPGNAHNRAYAYSYDRRGNLTRWADGTTGLHLNYHYDENGNLARAYTDLGYDPDDKNAGDDQNYRFIDHVYRYDDANRPIELTQGTGLLWGYAYDEAGNRARWNNAGTEVTYGYDANGRVVQGTWNSNADRQSWTYDANGNVLSFRQSGSQTVSIDNAYDALNRNTSTTRDGQVTERSYDASGRLTRLVLRDKGKTYSYDYSYYGDGREASIRAFGDARGNSTSAYDANKNRIHINQGRGDGQDRAEQKWMTLDNDGRIVHFEHDDGKSGTREVRDYVYANGHPVGERGHGTDTTTNTTTLDTGRYNLLQNLGEEVPAPSLTTYTVRSGDTLQGIAAAVYGNPSLWFVIAEANGLTGSESLKEGQTLTIPNTIDSGRLTAETHRLYSESEIVGSTLPNLETPPPPKKKGCSNIIAIIIVVVIAIVVAIFTAGAGLALLGAVYGTTFATVGAAVATAGFFATVAAFAVAGAVVAAIGNIVQQGLFIALGYQEEFSWSQVGTAALSGALSGAASGVAAGAGALAEAGKITAQTAQYAKVAAGALKAGSVAVKQYRENGKITSWTSLAAAAIGGYVEAGQSIEAGTATAAKLAGDQSTLDTALTATRSLQTIKTIADYATPWVQLAETYIRNDGNLEPADWANAIGGTLSQAVTGLGESALDKALFRTGANLLVAGVLHQYDQDAAQSYLEGAIGNEVGQYLGQGLAEYIKSTGILPKDRGLVYDPDKDTFFDRDTKSFYDQNKGAFVDGRGNVVFAFAKQEREDTSVQPQTAAQIVQQAGPQAPPTTDDERARMRAELIHPVQYDENGRLIAPEEEQFIGKNVFFRRSSEQLLGGENRAVGETNSLSTYTVQKGDTLWGIARRQLGSDATDADILAQTLKLMEANPFIDPNRLAVGAELNTYIVGTDPTVTTREKFRYAEALARDPKGISENGYTASAEYKRDLYARMESTPTGAAVAERMRTLEKEGLRIVFSPNASSPAAYVTGGSTIILDPTYYLGYGDTDRKSGYIGSDGRYVSYSYNQASLLIHEGTHAIVEAASKRGQFSDYDPDSIANESVAYAMSARYRMELAARGIKFEAPESYPWNDRVMRIRADITRSGGADWASEPFAKEAEERNAKFGLYAIVDAERSGKVKPMTPVETAMRDLQAGDLGLTQTSRFLDQRIPRYWKSSEVPSPQQTQKYYEQTLRLLSL